MPLGPGVRFRWKKLKNGKRVRLAFKGNTVIEVKPENGRAMRINGKSAKDLLSGR